MTLIELDHVRERSEIPSHDLRNLVIVPSHATLRKDVMEIPDSLDLLDENANIDDLLYEQSFQKGEGKYYLQHIRAGIEQAVEDPSALLVFSGAVTREKDGKSEADSYRFLCERMAEQLFEQTRDGRYLEVKRRMTEDEGALDSFQNVLGGLCVYNNVTHGRDPENVTIVGWKFKQDRFNQHIEAVGYPADRVRYIGVNNPDNLEAAVIGEKNTLEAFQNDPFGATGKLREKRDARNVNGIDQSKYYGRLVGDTKPSLAHFAKETLRPIAGSAPFVRRPNWEIREPQLQAAGGR